MKNLCVFTFLCFLILSCKKDEDSSTTNSGSISSSACCPSGFISTSGGSNNPDSVYLNGQWTNYYIIVEDGTYSDSATIGGYDGYDNNPPLNTYDDNPNNNCLIYKEFGNIFGGGVYWSDIFFKDITLAIYLPFEETDLESLPIGKYGFIDNYNAWFDTPKQRCIGSMHLQFVIGNEKYRSALQTNNNTYYNEIQEISFYGYDLADKIYSIKGVGNVLTQSDSGTKTVNLKYRILVNYDG